MPPPPGGRAGQRAGQHRQRGAGRLPRILLRHPVEQVARGFAQRQRAIRFGQRAATQIGGAFAVPDLDRGERLSLRLQRAAARAQRLAGGGGAALQRAGRRDLGTDAGGAFADRGDDRRQHGAQMDQILDRARLRDRHRRGPERERLQRREQPRDRCLFRRQPGAAFGQQPRDDRRPRLRCDQPGLGGGDALGQPLPLGGGAGGGVALGGGGDQQRFGAAAGGGGGVAGRDQPLALRVDGRGRRITSGGGRGAGGGRGSGGDHRPGQQQRRDGGGHDRPRRHHPSR